MSVYSNNRFLQRVNPEIKRALADSGSSLEHPEIQQLMRQMVDMKYTIPILESGWGSSGYGDYVFFYNNYPGVHQFEEYKNLSINTTGNYIYVGSNYPPNLPFPNVLYIEVPSNVGVTANDVASFETYLAANSIVIKRCIADNLKLWVHSGLVKTRTSGSDLYVPKAYDISGEENDAVQATTNNQPELVSAGFNYKLEDYIAAPNTSSLRFTSMLTVLAWINWDIVSGSNGAIVGQYYHAENDSSYLIRRFTNNRIQEVLILETGAFVNNKKRYRGSINVFDGSWHLIGFTWDNGVLKLFTDGDEDTSVNKVDDDSFNSIYVSEVEPCIIGHTSDFARPFGGVLNDIRIFNKALSATEISAIFNATKGFYGIT